MKRVLSIVLSVLTTLVMCLTFAACTESATTSEAPAKDEFLGLREGQEFVTDKEIKLSFLRPTGNSAQENWWKVTIADFNEKYKGRIAVTETTLTRGNSNEYEQQISLRAAEGSLPDVLYFDGPYVSNYAYADIIVPLDNYITEQYTSDFLPQVIDQGTYNDRLYALSIVDSAVVLAYNKKLMADAGITIPSSISEAWTWQQVKTIAESLTTILPSGKTRYGLNIVGDQGEWMSYAFYPMWTKGTMDSTGKVSSGYLDGEEGVSAARFLQSLTTKAINKNGTVGDFTNSECLAVMWLCGTQEISTFELLSEFKDNYGITYYPRNNEGSYGAPCGGWTMGMTSCCSVDRRVAAAEFIKYMTSVENVETFAQQSYSPPARKSVLDIIDIYNLNSNYMAIKEQVLNAAKLRVKTIGYAEYTPQMSEALNDIIGNSSIDAASRLTLAAQTIDNKIKKLKY